jgi:hypothetical protein
MRKSHLLGAMCACIILNIFPFTSVSAAIVTYDEANDGDLVHTGNILTTTIIGTFDQGLNTVSGSLSWPDGGTPDVDPFRFIIPTDHYVESLIVNFNSTVSTASFCFLLTDSVTSIGEQCYEGSDSIPLTLFPSLMPLGADTYYLQHSYSSRPGGSSPINDYTIEFTVSSVPIPTAAWLFGSGLLGLMGVAKNKTF